MIAVSPEIPTNAAVAPNNEIAPTVDQSPACSTYNLSRNASASENVRRAWATRRLNLQASSTRASERTRFSRDIYVAEPAIDERRSEIAKQIQKNLRIKRQKQDESTEQTHLIIQKNKTLERQNHQMKFENKSLRKELESQKKLTKKDRTALGHMFDNIDLNPRYSDAEKDEAFQKILRMMFTKGHPRKGNSFRAIKTIELVAEQFTFGVPPVLAATPCTNYTGLNASRDGASENPTISRTHDHGNGT